MKLPYLITLLAACGFAHADCPSTLPLSGFTSIDNCDPSRATCVDAGAALFDYMDARKDDDPTVLVIGLHASPWHLYGPEYHIMEIEELAALVKQQGNKIKHVILLASWSGVAPDAHSPSLAQKLSLALRGMRVSGQDGFVWYEKSGAVHTTRQAFSGYKTGIYRVATGSKVMASLVAGWPAGLESEFAKRRDGEGMMRSGVGADVFMLCPDGALRAYDASADLSNPIGAYNAAIMRLERGRAGDKQQAIALLKKSAVLGDKKAPAKLKALGVNL